MALFRILIKQTAETISTVKLQFNLTPLKEMLNDFNLKKTRTSI